MSKYKVGDKVVIRKDLVVGVEYGGVEWWSDENEYMKEKDYIIIERNIAGDYVVEGGWYLTDEMIEGLYEEVPYKELVLKFHKMMKTLGKSDTEITKSLEEINTKIKSEIEEVAMKTKVKYKIGDKVVINKDLVVGEWYGNWCWSDGKEYMKDKDYVVIDEVYDLKYQVENGKIISHEMIDGLYEEEKDMNIEDLKKQIEHYFNKNVSKIGDVILDSKSRDKFNVKYINEYEIELQEKKVKINKFLLDLLKLDDELKSMVNYK